jgi:hypothetical protein
MDNISNGLGFGADPKAAVMNQVRQEAAMTNARQLIEVCALPLDIEFNSNIWAESQRALLREMRSQTRLLIIKRRDNVLYAVHGEVYGSLEYRQ